MVYISSVGQKLPGKTEVREGRTLSQGRRTSEVGVTKKAIRIPKLCFAA